MCSFVGNNTFEVDCPYRPYRGNIRSNKVYNVKSLKEGSDVEKDTDDKHVDEDSDSDDTDENDRPLVLFKNQVEEVIHTFSDV